MLLNPNEYFVNQLLMWSDGYDRQLPWKSTENPYHIWVSEVVLQQTRVEQGLPYYHKLIDRYPDIHALASTKEDDFLKTWQGLGYYSRARNMLETAKTVVNEMNGHFPETYDELVNLKGIGPYTAAAISSFAFGESQAVVDGNVFRVLTRYFGIYEAIDSPRGKKKCHDLANELITGNDPGKYNQAIMDFGSQVCTPGVPKCEECPLKDRCVAFANGQVSVLPVKKKKREARNRYFNFLVINFNGNLIIEKRVGRDIWNGLYQFPLIETNGEVTFDIIKNSAEWDQLFGGLKYQVGYEVVNLEQKLSHQKIYGKFVQVLAENWISDSFKIAPFGILNNFAFPKIVDCYLSDYFISL